MLPRINLSHLQSGHWTAEIEEIVIHLKGNQCSVVSGRLHWGSTFPSELWPKIYHCNFELWFPRLSRLRPQSCPSPTVHPSISFLCRVSASRSWKSCIVSALTWEKRYALDWSTYKKSRWYRLFYSSFHKSVSELYSLVPKCLGTLHFWCFEVTQNTSDKLVDYFRVAVRSGMFVYVCSNFHGWSGTGLFFSYVLTHRDD